MYIFHKLEWRKAQTATSAFLGLEIKTKKTNKQKSTNWRMNNAVRYSPPMLSFQELFIVSFVSFFTAKIFVTEQAGFTI